jgi:hypothetical protein
MAGAFQNHLHAMYGLPGGLISNTDTSDILDAYKRREKRKQEQLEEELAIEILASRMKQDIVISPEVDTQKLAKILTAKMAKQPDNIDQYRRIKLLISILSMED